MYHLIVLENALEAVLEWSPILNHHLGHRRFTQYLLHSSFRSHYSGQLVIPAHYIAKMYGVEDQYASRNVRTEYYLEKYRAEVAPQFEWSGHHSGGRAREVVNYGIPEHILQLRNRYLEMVPSEVDRRYFMTGNMVTGNARKEALQQLKDEAARGDATSYASRRWLEYLNARSPRLFSELRNYIPEASEVAKGFEGEKRYQALEHLHAISTHTQPVYGYCENSVRLKTHGLSLQTIDSKLRRILTADWTELDLSKAQAAIAAKDWELTELYRFLASGNDLWESLLLHMGLEPENRNHKKVVKTGMYSTIFGANEGGITYFMSQEYEGLMGGYPSEAVYQDLQRFLTHPLILEALEARESRLDDIRRKGGAIDCFGRWISIDTINKPNRARSVLAQLAQAREMDLLMPALELAEEEAKKDRPNFQIALLQHDGFSVKFRQKRTAEYHTQRIIDAVNARAQMLGYPTYLEVA